MMFKPLLALLFAASFCLHAQELSLSARLSQPDGSPLEGVVDLRFELSYSDAPETVICTKDMTGTSLTNGLFQLGLNFSTAECGGSSLSDVLESVPASEAMLFRVVDVTDPANPRTYPFQSLKAVPLSVRSEVAQTLARNSAVEGQVLRFVGGEWTASNETAEVGTVSEINTGAGLTGGPITSSGTIAIASGGVTSTMVADGTLVDADLSATAAIARNKLATGTANYVLVNDGSGVMSEIAILPLTSGGTGAANAADARFNLGLGNAALRNVGLLAGELLDSGEIPSCALDEKIRKVVMPVAGFICESGADATKLALAGGTMSGPIDMNSNTIANLADPSLAQDAATKAYVDGQIGGGAANQWSESGGNVYRASGRVGIGTSSPSVTLDVAGSIRADGQVTNGVMLPGGYTQSNPMIMRFDQNVLAYADKWATVTSTPAFSFAKLFNIDDGSVNLHDINAGGPVVIEVSGISIGNTANSSFWPFVFYHANASGNVRMEIFNSADNWETAYDGPAAGYVLQKFSQSAGVLRGARFTFYDMNPNTFLRTVGVMGRNASPYQWVLKRNGGSIFGSLGIQENLGVGTLSPTATLEVAGQMKVTGGDPGAGKVLTSDASGLASWVAPSTTATPEGAASGDLSGNYPGPVVAAGAINDAKVAADANIAQSKIANLTTDLAAKQSTDADLNAISSLTTTGVMVRTGEGAYQTRAIEGTANRISVTNGNGVSANPSINIDPSLLPSPLAGDVGKFLRPTAANSATWQILQSSDITTALGFTPINKAGDIIGSGVFDFNSSAVVRANDPVGTRDVATKNYVDLEVSGAPNQWTAAGANVYRSNGNVGIGTATPFYKLDIANGGGSSILRLGGASGSADSSVRLMEDSGGGDVYGFSLTHDAQLNQFHILRHENSSVGVPAMTINRNSGNIGIGTSTPAFDTPWPSPALDISGTRGTAMLRTTDVNGLSTLRMSGPTNGSDFHINFSDNTGGLTFAPQQGSISALTVAKNGNVGIGTASPTSNLHISSNNISNTGLNITNSDAGGNTFTLMTTGSSAPHGAGAFSIYDNNRTQHDFVVKGGNVGVGTIEPLAKLSLKDGAFKMSPKEVGFSDFYEVPVAGDVSEGESFRMFLQNDQLANSYGTGNNNAVIFENQDGNNPNPDDGMYFFNTGSDGVPELAMLINGNGNVGVGTFSPNERLEVNGRIRLSPNSGWSQQLTIGIDASLNTPGAVHATVGATNGNLHLEPRNGGFDTYINHYTIGDNDIFMQTGNSTGNVGVGTTNPVHKVDVVGDINSSTRLRIAGVEVCTSTGCTTSSDERLKEKITPFQNSLEKVLSLKGVNYEYRDKEKFSDESQIGFIAQDVEKVYPEVVRTDKETGFKSVAYSHLVVPLVESLKEIYQMVLQSSDTSDENSRGLAMIKEDMESLRLENERLKEQNTAVIEHLCQKDPSAVFCQK